MSSKVSTAHPKEILFFSEKDPYFEFSNYSKISCEIDGYQIEFLEKYFQMEKFNVPENEYCMEYRNLIYQCDSPQKAKDLSNQKSNSRADSWYINKNRKDLGKVNDVIRDLSDNLVKLK